MPNDFVVRVASYGPARKSANLIMYYVDSVTGKRVTKSAGTANRSKALKAAGGWQNELNEGRYRKTVQITWDAFRERYEQEKLAGLSEGTQENAATVFNHFEQIMAPKYLAAVDTDLVSRFQSKLHAKGIKETTINGYLRHLRLALRWAVSLKLLRELPEIHWYRKPKGINTAMRGRPITAEELDRMLKVCSEVRPRDPGVWTRYLYGLWLSGLRLKESMALSWDQDEPFAVDLSGRRPAFRCFAEAQKRKQDLRFPMAPDFAAWLLQTPEEERQGRVFKLVGLESGLPMTDKTVARLVSKIGRRAGVVVNKTEGKYASAHDCRRAFATRWAPRVKPAVLQELMRHASYETTKRYYIGLNVDDTADELWAKFGPPDVAPAPAPAPTRQRGKKQKRASAHD